MAEDTQIEPPRRNRAPTVVKWGAIVIGGLVVLVAALMIGLNTGPGKRFVAAQIGALEFENGMGINVLDANPLNTTWNNSRLDGKCGFTEVK